MRRATGTHEVVDSLHSMPCAALVALRFGTWKNVLIVSRGDW
jgi:hypothetical protein